MMLLVDNQLVTLEELRRAWLDHVTVELGDSARRRVAESNELIDDVVAHGDQVYGVNTGFGQLASVRISDDELVHLQENLVRSHAVGVGDSSCS
jgi:histidine ammonia-lyase